MVECTEDYKSLYRELRTKQKIPVNIIVVPNGKLEPSKRIYSNRKMDVLKSEHGFFCFLDETCTAPDPIMAAMIAKHSIDSVLVGGEGVSRSLARGDDLLEFLCEKEGGNGKMSACFFYTDQGTSKKRTANISRHNGSIGASKDDVGPAKVLQSGMDPREKEQLTKTIENAEETIERLTPDIEKCKAEQDKLQAHGQALSVRQKDAKRIKTDYAQYKTKLKNQRQKVADAEENANTDNDGEKSRRIDQIKKLIQLNIKSGEDAAKAYSEMMKSTRVITGVKMTEYGLSESLRKLT